MIVDSNFKLIGGTIHDYLASVHFDSPEGGSIVTCAPAGRQNQNGLAEIKWCHVMDMVCKWILSNYLPKKFWYFGLRAAAC
eukprot:9256148-Ditylum_brightwellii.AAC.1